MWTRPRIWEHPSCAASSFQDCAPGLAPACYAESSHNRIVTSWPTFFVCKTREDGHLVIAIPSRALINAHGTSLDSKDLLIRNDNSASRRQFSPMDPPVFRLGGVNVCISWRKW